MSNTSTATAGRPAQTATDTLYVIRSLLDGDVMEVLGSSPEPGTPVKTSSESFAPAANQQWRFVGVEPGWWFIETAMGTGFVMTLDTNIPDDKPPIVVAPKRVDDLDDQLWSLVPTGTLGYWYIQSKVGANVMDIEGAQRGEGIPIIGFGRKYDGYENQAWGFAPVHES